MVHPSLASECPPYPPFPFLYFVTLTDIVPIFSTIKKREREMLNGDHVDKNPSTRVVQCCVNEDNTASFWHAASIQWKTAVATITTTIGEPYATSWRLYESGLLSLNLMETRLKKKEGWITSTMRNEKWEANELGRKAPSRWRFIVSYLSKWARFNESGQWTLERHNNARIRSGEWGFVLSPFCKLVIR